MIRPKLTPALRARALLTAEEMLADLHSEPEIRVALVKRYRCTENVANALVREALARLREADDGDKATRTARMYASIGKLYRTAHKAERYAVCRNLLADLRRMQGLDAPLKVQPVAAGQGTDEQQRTDQELEYFLEHGYYPEEAPRPAGGAAARKQPASNDPLAKLH